MTRLVLKRGRAKPLWNGHPWVYSGAVEHVEGKLEAGSIVTVSDHAGQFIGQGFANPNSQIICRLASWRANEILNDRWIFQRLLQAQLVRRKLGLPTDATNAYRLVNSEGDGLPGLIVDVYDRVLAVQFTALGLKLRAQTVVSQLAELLQPGAIVEVGGQAFSQVEGFAVQPAVLWGQTEMPIACRENGLVYQVDLFAGQKTGLYLDQRENRALFGSLASGSRVLDLHTYVGGFALEAARGGAAQVTAVDVSARAIEWAKRNAAANQLHVDFAEADAFRFLEAASPQSYDLICLDPPKFARAQKDLPAALKGYKRLNALALRALAESGMLLTCTCSQLVSWEDFERVVAAAGVEAGRTVRRLRATEQAADHGSPVSFPEGRYLKCLLLAAA